VVKTLSAAKKYEDTLLLPGRGGKSLNGIRLRCVVVVVVWDLCANLCITREYRGVAVVGPFVGIRDMRRPGRPG
jgi:hypothetical protein